MQLRIFTEPQQGASYDTLLAVARAAENLGFDAFFRSDHYLKMGPGSGLPGPTDAWVTLAGLARETSRIRLGTLMTPATFRLPGPLAITVAQVDQMSGGRVEFGFGVGWFAAEHEAYGIRSRYRRALRPAGGAAGDHHRLWETPEGDKFSFSGTALLGSRLAGAAQARPAAAAARARRRHRSAPDAAAGRAVRG
jgi:hypothetical protein